MSHLYDVNILPPAVFTALRGEPTAIITNTGVELPREGQQNEVLVSWLGLQDYLESFKQPEAQAQEAVEQPVAEQPAEEPVVEKKKPGPKPKPKAETEA